MLKWALALTTAIMLHLSWGSENLMHFCSYFFLCPLLIAENFLTKKLPIKYALGFFFLVLFHLARGIYLINDIALLSIVVLLAFNAFLFSLPWALYVTLKNKFGLSSSLISLIILWLSLEQVSGITGIPSPWFRLGNGLAGRPEFIQFYEFTGVAGGTLWILLSNCSLFYALDSFLRQRTAMYCLRAFSFAICMLFLPMLISKEIKFISSGQAEEAIVIDTNQTNETILKVTFNELLGESLKNISEQTRYIIWPESIFESAIPYDNIEKSPLVTDVRKYLLGHDSMIFVCGLVLTNKNKNYNTALIVSSKNVTIYKKRQLAPFSEYHPSFLGSLKIFKWSDDEISPGNNTMTENNTLSVNICYETLFGKLVAENCQRSKGKVMTIISNESWTRGASEFLLLICSIRAIENRKYLLRSTNNGITSIIKPDGAVIISPQNHKPISTLKVKIIPNNYQTFYMRYGDFIGWSALVVLTGFSFLLLIGKIKLPKNLSPDKMPIVP